jgi:hypothetical protein
MTKAPVYPSFIVAKYYDKSSFANIVDYNISGLFDLDRPYITLSSKVYGRYRDLNAGTNIPVDISAISLYAYTVYPSAASRKILTDNYSIQSTVTSSGVIYQKYLTFTGIDKIYDRKTVARVTMSGIISGDSIEYMADFVTYPVSNNIPVYVDLSNLTIKYINNDDAIIRYTFKNDSSGVNIKNNATGLYDAQLVNGASIVADANSRIPGETYLKLLQSSSTYVR